MHWYLREEAVSHGWLYEKELEEVRSYRYSSKGLYLFLRSHQIQWWAEAVKWKDNQALKRTLFLARILNAYLIGGKWFLWAMPIGVTNSAASFSRRFLLTGTSGLSVEKQLSGANIMKRRVEKLSWFCLSYWYKENWFSTLVKAKYVFL